MSGSITVKAILAWLALSLIVGTSVPAQRRKTTSHREKEHVFSARQIFDKFSPRIVLIKTSDELGNPVAQASGVVISSDGYVATSGHVVVDCFSVKASLPLQNFGGRVEFNDLRLAFYDQNSDVAILKIDGRNLPHLDFSVSVTTKAGE